MPRGTVTGLGTPVLHAAASVGSGRHACVRRQPECGSNPPVLHLSNARGLHDTGHCLRAKFVVAGTRAAEIRVPVSRKVWSRATHPGVGLCRRCHRLPVSLASVERCYNCLEKGAEAVDRTRRKYREIWRSSVAGIDRRQSKQAAGGLDWALVQHRERMEGYGE